MKKEILLMCLQRKGYPGLFLCLLLVILSSAANSQTLLVKGKVVDETGSAIPGVNIVIKSTANGTVSDQNGEFTLNVSGDNDVLSFSFIGYATQDISVAGRSFIDVKLAFDAKELGEVV